MSLVRDRASEGIPGQQVLQKAISSPTVEVVLSEGG